MAQRAGTPVVPHAANVSLVEVFSLHLMAAAPNAGEFLEFTIEEDAAINRLSADMYEPQLAVRDGRVRVPDGAGWGVRIRADWLDAAERRTTP
jgi:L-alanine-DL-glutamate epimerase-like enolase superfamily enzyme